MRTDQCKLLLKHFSSASPAVGPFFSWPAVFLPGEQASVAFSFINSMGAVGGFIGPWVSAAVWAAERLAVGGCACLPSKPCQLSARPRMALMEWHVDQH